MSIATATPTLPNLGDKLYWSPLDIARLLGVSRRTVWAMIARRQLPRPLKISRNVVRWPAAAIAEFVARLNPSA